MHPEDASVGPLLGTVIAEVLEYDGGRRTTVYVPPTSPDLVIFAGDGHLVREWAVEVEATGRRSVMIVGVHRAEDEETRLHEYSPTLRPGRFAAHEHFFMVDVRAWVSTRFGVAPEAQQTAVFGVSAGGELALALGLRHPAVFGAIFSASPGGGYRPSSPLPVPAPRTYLVAGTLEPFFRDNAVAWAAALRESGADVVMVERVAGHDRVMWREELPRMIAWAFDR